MQKRARGVRVVRRGRWRLVFSAAGEAGAGTLRADLFLRTRKAQRHLEVEGRWVRLPEAAVVTAAPVGSRTADLRAAALELFDELERWATKEHPWHRSVTARWA